jgi:integrase
MSTSSSMKSDNELLQDFSQARNLKKSTVESYKIILQGYTRQQEATMVELLQEAEAEEEAGVRWKYRQLRKRLIQYRTYLYNTYSSTTAKMHISKIMTVYRHYEVEIHPLPQYSMKNINTTPPVTFKDLPDHEVIRKALNISTPRMRALLLFISSSGCGRSETCHLTVQDFINATNDYHQTNNIYTVLNQLKDKTDIVPRWQLRRKKTGKYYTTFTSPEATNELINYLISSNRNLHNDDRLFGIGIQYLNRLFHETNNKLGLGEVNGYSRLRPHMLRKYHASQLFNDGASIEFIDALQGRGKDQTHTAYFMEDPEKLRQEYINHLDCLMINWNNIDYKSPEYLELEQKYEQKTAEVESMNDRLRSIEDLLFNDEVRSIVDRFRK